MSEVQDWSTEYVSDDHENYSAVDLYKATVVAVPSDYNKLCPVSYNESTVVILRDGCFTTLHVFAETQTWLV